MPDAPVAPAATAPASSPEEARGRISYTGLVGGLWAIVTFVALTVLATFDSESNSLLVILFGVIALAFVPAAVYSVLPGAQRREAVLRFETVLCLAVAAIGTFVLLIPAWPIIMSPPTVLIATGAGFVFTGRRGKTG